MDADQYSIAEQRNVTDGRIVPVGKGFVAGELDRMRYHVNTAIQLVAAMANGGIPPGQELVRLRNECKQVQDILSRNG